MQSSNKALILFLPLISLFLQTSDFTKNRELHKNPIWNNHSIYSFQSKAFLITFDLNLNKSFISEDNKSFGEEEEPRSARNRIGSTSVKKFRPIENHFNFAFHVNNKSDTGDLTTHQLHLRL